MSVSLLKVSEALCDHKLRNSRPTNKEMVGGVVSRETLPPAEAPNVVAKTPAGGPSAILVTDLAGFSL